MQILRNADNSLINPQVPPPAETNPAFAPVQPSTAKVTVNGTAYPQYGITGIPAAPVAAPARNPGAMMAMPAPAGKVDLSLIPRAPSSSEIIAAAQRNYREPGNFATAFAQGWTNAAAVSSAADREREDAIAKTTYEQNQALKKQAEADRLKARQVEYIRARSPEMADAVDAGIMDAGTAFTEWKKAQKGGKKNFVTLPNGDYGFADEENGTIKIVGSAAKPQGANSEIGKLAEDFNAGRIDRKQYDAALAKMAPKGMMIKSDGAGGFTMTEGPVGEGGVKFTEAQSKDNVFSTRARGALPTLDKMADNLMGRIDRAAEMDPTGFAREWFQSEDYQVAKAAGDEFLQAILRKDTGAAITPAEQQLYGVTYLPQPGDGPDVRAYKQQARERAIAAIEAGMSPAQMVAQEKALSRSGQGQAGGTPPQQATQGQTQAPASSPALDKARAAIAAGADPEKVKQRLIENGIEPTGL